MLENQNDLEKERRYTRRAFIALIAVYTIIGAVGTIKSCNDRLRGIESICFADANRAGAQCVEKPILRGGDENEGR